MAFALYLVLAVLSAVVLQLLPMPHADAAAADDNGDGGDGERVLPARPVTQCCARVWTASQLMVRDRKVMLVSGVNITFGVTSAFLNSYVTGTVITQSLGAGKVGYFVAIIPLVATALSIPLAKASSLHGSKVPAMVFGMLCFFAFGLSFAAVRDPVTELGKWTVLPVLFCVFGAARAVWEGPNKAVFADFFTGEDVQPGFSNLVFQTGVSSALAFYAFPSINFRTSAWACAGVSVLAVAGYLAADGHHRAELRAQREQQG